MLFGALAPLVPGYAEEFGLSKTGAGLLVGAFGAGAAARRRSRAGSPPHAFGPKLAVVAGLVLLAVASFAFAAADGAWALGIARFVQGFSSTITWAGALAWLTVATPRERRGELIGTAFGAAVFGAILGPMFGAVADAVSVRDHVRRRRRRRAFARSLAQPPARAAPPQEHAPRRRRAAPLPTPASSAASGSTRCRRSSSAMLVVLVPLRLDDGGFTPARDRGRVPRSPACSRRPSTRFSAASPTGAVACSPSALRWPARSPSRSPSPSRATPTPSRASPCSPQSPSAASTRPGWRSSPTAPSSPGSRRRSASGS